MRNIFLFIRSHFVLLTFLVLQFVALWMLYNYNRFHRTVFLGVASEVTGGLSSQVDKVDDYFNLREENRRVHRMNDSLMNLLTTNFNIPDTGSRIVTDSVTFDTVNRFRRYIYRDAKVVYNTLNFDNNYLQLNRGSNQGIKDNMAVINSNGAIVGVVVNVSPNFSQVMSLLHTKSRIPALLKKNNNTGTILWDTKDPRFLTLEGISKDVDVKKGDTVLTGQYSYNFPPHFIVGTVESAVVDKAKGFYDLKVRCGTNFSSIQQVFIVENLQRDEQLDLDRDTERKIEGTKNTNR